MWFSKTSDSPPVIRPGNNKRHRFRSLDFKNSAQCSSYSIIYYQNVLTQEKGPFEKDPFITISILRGTVFDTKNCSRFTFPSQ